MRLSRIATVDCQRIVAQRVIAHRDTSKGPQVKHR